MYGMSVCLYVCMYVCTYLSTYLPIYLSTYLPIYVSMYLCTYVSMSILYWVMILDIVIDLCINDILVLYLLWMKKACDKTIEPHTRHSQPLIRVPGWNSWGLLHAKSGDMHCPHCPHKGSMAAGCYRDISAKKPSHQTSVVKPPGHPAPVAVEHQLVCLTLGTLHVWSVGQIWSSDFPWCWLLFDHYCSLLVGFLQ